MAIINGTNGNDRIIDTPREDTINAPGGDDRVNAQAGDDAVFGGTGNDNLGGGSDDILGEDGRDFLQGGSGANDSDTLDGGASNDRLFGGGFRGANGNDTFLYATEGLGDDRILDFGKPLAQLGNPGTGDLIDLTDASEAEIEAFYGDKINAAEAGVTNDRGDLVIDFGPSSLPGSGILTLDDGLSPWEPMA
jgi:Ca2+-binding RTX toxin-like protein